MKMQRNGWKRMVMMAVVGLVATLGWASTAKAAGLLIADGGFGGVLEIKEHSVNVTVNNGVAVTDVTQVFVNTENRQVEALYTFPVPKGASVSNFSMWIDGKEMTGEVLEKKRAREIYESYKRVKRDPGLLEQKDYKTFEMRIFPIGPKAEQKVQISYYQELDYDNDWATYVYPLATTTRAAIDTRTTDKFAFNLEARSEVPIVALESPSHADDVVVTRYSDAYSRASLETRVGDLNRDIVIAYHLSRARTGIDIITSREPGEDGYFCLMLTAGEELAQKQSGMDYAFILDVSGSMNSDGKLRLSRNSLGAFVNALGSEDRFEVIAFNAAPLPLFQKLEGATAETKAKAVDFLASQRARGGTVLNTAVNTAYRYRDTDRSLNVVILSDGLTEQGERATLRQVIRTRPDNTRVFCIGVGNDVNRPLLRQVANESGGLAAFISRGDNFERQAKAFRRKLMRPVAENLEINLEGVEVYDVEPTRLPNLYHGMPVRLYGRYRGQGPAKVAIRADVGSIELKKSFDISLPVKDDANPEIERMWAWHKAQRLIDDVKDGAAGEGVLNEIVRLGEGYSIVTEYTSFIVLENDAEYKRWKIERRNALRIKRDRASRRRLSEQLEKIRTQAAADLGPVVPDEIVNSAPKVNTRQVAQRTTRPASSRSRSIDFDLPSMGGGGAVDPFTGSLVLGLGILAMAVGAMRRGKGRG